MNTARIDEAIPHSERAIELDPFNGTYHGLYAVVLLGLVIDTLRRRKQLTPQEIQLWLYVLGFLIIYSIPTQRQENYILPTCAALSVLLALRWQALPALWFRITLVVMACLFAATFWIQGAVEHAFGAQLFTWKNTLVPLLFFALSVFSLARIQTGRLLLPLIAPAIGVVVIISVSVLFVNRQWQWHYVGFGTLGLFLFDTAGVLKLIDAAADRALIRTAWQAPVQQFQRAAALICACELVRKNDEETWGSEPFRIGLWVGRKTTPNYAKDSQKASQMNELSAF